LPLKECAPILFQLEKMLRDKYRIGHSALQFECQEHPGKCREIDGLYCQMEKETIDHEHEETHASIPLVEKG